MPIYSDILSLTTAAVAYSGVLDASTAAVAYSGVLDASTAAVAYSNTLTVLTAPDTDPQGIADAVAEWIARELGELLPGGVLCDEHPADAGLPRAAVVDLGGASVYDTLAASPVEESEVQVTVFALGRAEARALGLAVRSGLIDAAAPLTPAAGHILYLRPSTPPVVTLDPAKGPGGEDVWRADLTLRALVEITDA